MLGGLPPGPADPTKPKRMLQICLGQSMPVLPISGDLPTHPDDAANLTASISIQTSKCWLTPPAATRT
jgi:hypothetical protein